MAQNPNNHEGPQIVSTSNGELPIIRRQRRPLVNLSKYRRGKTPRDRLREQSEVATTIIPRDDEAPEENDIQHPQEDTLPPEDADPPQQDTLSEEQEEEQEDPDAPTPYFSLDGNDILANGQKVAMLDQTGRLRCLPNFGVYREEIDAFLRSRHTPGDPEEDDDDPEL